MPNHQSRIEPPKNNQSTRPLDISVIIVNYNTIDLLSQCLVSITKQKNATFEVIVVDNASKDNSAQLIKSSFKAVRLIENTSNVGFSRANNQAIHLAKGRFLFFLNPDTEVQPGAFAAILQYFSTAPEIGLAGTRIVNPDGSQQSSVEYRYPGQRFAKCELDGLPGKIAWLLGASIIARSELINVIDGFDERYFLYGEDMDLCLCARKQGWPIGYIPNAVISHWGGQSERPTPPVEVWRKKFHAEMVFYRKHYCEKTVQAIRRSNIRQAYWRILTLTLTLPFILHKDYARAKLLKYRLQLDIFKTPL